MTRRQGVARIERSNGYVIRYKTPTGWAVAQYHVTPKGWAWLWRRTYFYDSESFFRADATFKRWGSE